MLGAPALAHAKSAHFQSYGGWATTDGATLMGRVVEGKAPSGKHRRSRWKKLTSTAKAFLRGDVEHARLVVTDTRTGKSIELRTDDEGFYDVRVPGPLDAGPNTFRIELIKSKYKPMPLEVTLDATVADATGALVICDIDDTLTDTGVTRGHLDVIIDTAQKDAGDMVPFPASVETLVALAAAGIPIIYVSASPIELAPRLTQFLRDRGYPPGAVLLRYYLEDGFGDPTSYKKARIGRLLADFPLRKIVLVGDNGEQDPELFASLAKDTGRVLVGWVRATLAVTGGDARYAGMVTFTSWREVARDAGRRGLIRWMSAQRIATGSP